MEKSQASIDAQYFLIKPDQAGELFLGKLLRAADRGVKVRLLIDDIFTPRMDSVLALLNTHDNVQVRLFNPLSRNSPVAWNMVFDFKRTNRRMHNKSFVVDGSLAIMGGRNIAEEYFELTEQQDFGDFELLMRGDIVSQISHSFDVFWNSELAVPMEAFGAVGSERRLNLWLDIMDDVASGKRPSAYAEAINTPFLQQIRSGEREAIVAPATLVYDPPDKLIAARRSREHRTLAAELKRRFDAATKEILLVTPYFIPRDEGVEWIRSITARGIRLVVVTNSLASTNHIAVHSGYARYRRDLLEAGVELYELRVDVQRDSDRKGFDAERLTLHSKAVVIDQDEVFAGSLNFDPRSIAINTEVGLFIDSPIKGKQIAERIENGIRNYAYQVKLNEKGQLRWYFHGTDGVEEYKSEPQSGGWRKFKAGFYGLLPIEDQL
jgi:putative cardiolipin synthase